MRRSFVVKFRVIRTKFRFDEAKFRFGKTKYRLDEKKFRFHETKFRLPERNFVFQEFVADYRIAVIITSCKSTGTCKRGPYLKKKHRNDCYNSGEILKQDVATTWFK